MAHDARMQESEFAFYAGLKSSVSSDAIREGDTVNGIVGFDVSNGAQLGSQQALRALSISPHGLPLSVLSGVCQYTELEQIGVVDCGFDKYAYLSPAIAASIRRTVSLSERQALHKSIWGQWSPAGWGYLRRAFHAFASGSASIVSKEAPAVLIGLNHLSKRAMYACVLQMWRMNSVNEFLNSDKLIVALPRLAKISGRRRAAYSIYQQSIRMAKVKEIQCMLYCDFANMLALERSTQAKTRARNLAVSALEFVEKCDNANKFYYSIRLLNILALLEYQQGDHYEALDIEQRARTLIESAENVPMAVIEWAHELVTLNTSRILVSRLNRHDTAEQMLDAVVSKEQFSGNGEVVIELAKLKLRNGRFDEVIHLVSRLLLKTDALGISPLRDVFCHLLASAAYEGKGERICSTAHLSKAKTMLNKDQALELERRFSMATRLPKREYANSDGL